MRCKKEDFIQGEYFHLYNRAVDGTLLFIEKDDSRYFIDKMIPKIKEYSASVFAYCLMPNHFHFLIKQNSDKAIFQIFNDVNNSYVKHFNFNYKRRGRLYQGNLNHKQVKDDKYLIALCQYIHFNPVKAKLVNKIEDWEFSNYSEWIRKRNRGLFDDELLKKYFYSSNNYEQQMKDYGKRVEEKKFSALLFD